MSHKHLKSESTHQNSSQIPFTKTQPDTILQKTLSLLCFDEQCVGKRTSTDFNKIITQTLDVLKHAKTFRFYLTPKFFELDEEKNAIESNRDDGYKLTSYFFSFMQHAPKFFIFENLSTFEILYTSRTDELVFYHVFEDTMGSFFSQPDKQDSLLHILRKMKNLQHLHIQKNLCFYPDEMNGLLANWLFGTTIQLKSLEINTPPMVNLPDLEKLTFQKADGKIGFKDIDRYTIVREIQCDVLSFRMYGVGHSFLGNPGHFLNISSFNLDNFNLKVLSRKIHCFQVNLIKVHMIGLTITDQLKAEKKLMFESKIEEFQQYGWWENVVLEIHVEN